MRTVFISYSHKDELWKEKLLPQLRTLVQAGLDMKVWHDRKINAGATWYPEIQNAMADAAVAVLLISADFLASGFCVKEEVPFLLERQEKLGMLLIPVLVRPCQWQAHRWLADRQMIPRDGKCISIDFPGDNADLIFSQVASQVYEFFLSKFGPMSSFDIPEQIAELAKARSAFIFPASRTTTNSPKWPHLPTNRVDLTHLPETGSALFGREEELQLLDIAWDSDADMSHGQDTTIRILAFTAHGGVGKSTLVNRWLDEMKRDNFRGATRVFGWSFYSQGVREEATVYADTFIDAALRFFGDSDPTAGTPWDKGERLASLVGTERALLVLDGMEPLQSAHAFERGKLRDPSIVSLLRNLAQQSTGLCIITTRESLTDFKEKSGFKSRDLEQISSQAGRALLRTARVIGTDAELEALAGRFGPHALAVSLLGVYLYEQPDHSTDPALELEQIECKEPVDRVLAGFEKWLGNSPECEILRLLGFFDRPANADCLQILCAKPAISNLTDCVAKLKKPDWDRIIEQLEKLRLINVRRCDSGRRFVDTHPLIREYFAKQLRENNSEAWREGNRRLYVYLRDSTTDKPHPNLDDLQPLYQAVAHGCQAGLQQEACDKIYFARILRSGEFYSRNTLGLYGADIGAITCFFDQPWSRVSPLLTKSDQAWLLNDVATILRPLGLLTEALEPIRAGLNMLVEAKYWGGATASAHNLSLMELTLGDLSSAVADAKQSVTFSEYSGETTLRIVSLSTLAVALHQIGQHDEALVLFREAEGWQAKHQPTYPLLHSLWGFQYCDLLLAASELAVWKETLKLKKKSQKSGLIETCHTVNHRAIGSQRAWQEIFTNQYPLLDIALDHLTLGRSMFYRAVLGNNDVLSAKSEIDQAVDGLRRAGTQDHLPRGLLTRAWLRCLTNDHLQTHPCAKSDLDEAYEIAERGSMKLYLADIHLHRARLFFCVHPYPWSNPKADLAEARRLIEACNYWRRREELEDAEAALMTN